MMRMPFISIKLFLSLPLVGTREKVISPKTVTESESFPPESATNSGYPCLPRLLRMSMILQKRTRGGMTANDESLTEHSFQDSSRH